MSYLLRRTRRWVWVGDTRDRAAAAQELERTADDTDGLSVFAADEADFPTVVAAVACGRQNCDKVDLLKLDRATVERYGRVDATPDKGTTCVPAANRLHCSLDWDPAALRLLAEALFDAGTTPLQYARQAVRGAVRLLDATTILGEEARAFVLAEKAKAP